MLGPAHNETLELMRVRGTLAAERGDPAAAERLYRERWEVARQHLGADHRVTLECRSLVALGAWRNGDLREAEAIYREVLDARRRVFGEEHEATRNSKRYLVKLLRETDRADEAATIEATLPPELRKPPL